MYESKTHVLSGLTKKEATNIVLFNIKEKYQHCPPPSLPQQIYRGHAGVVHYAITRCSFPEKILVYICMYCVRMYCNWLFGIYQVLRELMLCSYILSKVNSHVFAYIYCIFVHVKGIFTPCRQYYKLLVVINCFVCILYVINWNISANCFQ
jgi:hypothetical protein